MINKKIIDASQCEWRTGVEHCGDYECMLNKCCDFNCDWYRRRKLEQQLDQLKAKTKKLEKWKKEHLNDVEFIKENPVIDILNSMADNIVLRQQLNQLKEHYEQQLKAVIDKHNELLKENKTKDTELMQLRRTLIEIRKIASKVLLNTHDLEQFKDADALFGALLEIHKKISESETNND